MSEEGRQRRPGNGYGRPGNGYVRRVEGLVSVALASVLVVSGCSALGTVGQQEVGDQEAVGDLAEDVGRIAAAPTILAPATMAPAGEPTQAGASTPLVESEKKARKPKVRTIRLKPRPAAGPFRMNLYDEGDFVHQQTKDWCVAGSTQTMMNIIDRGRPDRSRRFQQALYSEGRRLSPDKAKLGPIGVDLTGWAELLNTKGYGPYVVDGAGTIRAAIRMAARALRETGRPVGLVTWRGAHSWVMSGFSASADPAFSDDFQVLKVYIQDVWYPYVSTIWGASRPPDSLVPVAALAEDYLPYRRPRGRYPKRDGRFMLILPTLPDDTVAR